MKIVSRAKPRQKSMVLGSRKAGPTMPRVEARSTTASMRPCYLRLSRSTARVLNSSLLTLVRRLSAVLAAEASWAFVQVVCRAKQNQATGQRKLRPLRRPLAEALANRKSREEKALRPIWSSQDQRLEPFLRGGRMA